MVNASTLRWPLRSASPWNGLVTMVAICVCWSGCSGDTRPATPLTPTAVVPGISGSTGSITWTSIESLAPLCGSITSQLGSSYPLWLTMMAGSGSSVTIVMSHEGPLGGGDEMDDPPGVFAGTRTGNVIDASYTGHLGLLACDGLVAPMTGG